MRIGIVTFHEARNYGAVLQAFALQKYLKSIGHDPFFVNYKYDWRQNQLGIKGWFSKSIRRSLEKWNDNLKEQEFCKFRNKYLNIDSKRFLGISQLRNDPPKSSVYICGSDQIWNPYSSKSDELIYWLKFGSKNTKRIAYAVSFGVSDLSKETRLRYKEYIKDINSIGVRERDAVELVKLLGRKGATWVPDPTILLKGSDYNIFGKEKIKIDYPFLFSYEIGNENEEQINRITSIACEVLDLTLCNVNNKINMKNIISEGIIGPEKWLTYINQSEFIVSNSYHATIFCILFHRPFIAILREGIYKKMNNRITSLLKLVGLQSRIITNKNTETVANICLTGIDWKRVDAKIIKFREKGVKYLTKALSMTNLKYGKYNK
jgi:hypothetical protein